MHRTHEYTADWTPAERAQYPAPREGSEAAAGPEPLRAVVRETLMTLGGGAGPDPELEGALLRHGGGPAAPAAVQLPVE